MTQWKFDLLNKLFGLYNCKFVYFGKWSPIFLLGISTFDSGRFRPALIDLSCGVKLKYFFILLTGKSRSTKKRGIYKLYKVWEFTERSCQTSMFVRENDRRKLSGYWNVDQICWLFGMRFVNIWNYWLIANLYISTIVWTDKKWPTLKCNAYNKITYYLDSR